jgi:hypothetical protein
VPFWRSLVCSSDDTLNGNVFVTEAPVASVTVNCTLNRPVAAGEPQISASPGVTPPPVTPSPKRRDMPAGSPAADHTNGAVPPENTPTARLHDTPRVQSSRALPYGLMFAGNSDAAPTTSIDIAFV